MDEDTDFEYPDEDEMESDNSYEDAMTELYDSVGMTQNAFIERGYNIINDGEGNPFEFKEMATQAK